MLNSLDFGGFMSFVAPEDDVKLCKSCLTGNKLGWDALVKKYSKLVYKTIWNTLKKYSKPRGIDVNDVYQDVFIKILEKLHQWKGEAPLAAWIRAIAFRTTIDKLRELKFVPLEKDERTDNPDPIPEIFVRELLEYLSPEERLQARLFFIEEWKPAEIAQFLKKEIGTVYVMKNRLLERLRTICQKNRLL